MNCEIVTGKAVLVEPKTVSEDQPRTLLFDYSSTKTVSHRVTVSECKAIRLSTFNLPEGNKLNVHRVFVGGGLMPQGYSCLCDTEEATPASAVMTEPLKIDCKPVFIDSCNSVLFLTIPGIYVLELEGDKSLLGNFLAFAEEVDCCCLPDGLIIGNRLANGSFVGV